MPNGKGALECCYCENFRSDSGYRGYDAAHEAGTCTFHERRLPATENTGQQRICIFFRATKEYYDHNSRHLLEGRFQQASPQIRFQWFGQELAEDLLYQFQYNNPPQVSPLAKIAELPRVDTAPDPPSAP
jgi:hypothetical protein